MVGKLELQSSSEKGGSPQVTKYKRERYRCIFVGGEMAILEWVWKIESRPDNASLPERCGTQL